MATSTRSASKRKPNLIFFGIDSLRADHMSLYGYPKLTTPNIDKFLRGGTVFGRALSAHIPTTSGYANMLSGQDCFGTNVVALRHKGGLADGVVTLPEALGENGYATTCVGFKGNPASRGFQKHLEFDGWGNSSDGRSHKAENLNAVAIPELRELAKGGKPFFLFMRHMDPHAPYRPPQPFERIFYGGNELDPKNKSMEPVFKFKPFGDFHASWFPEGLTDKDYAIAQYDGEIAYMDACIQNILSEVAALGLEDDSLIVFTSDHGETLYDHDCHFDHHGLYEPTLRVPLAFWMPGKVPAGLRLSGQTTHPNIMPTVLDLLGIKAKAKFSGKSLAGEMRGEPRKPDTEIYITEATWMRKHGWRTPEWKLIHALEPDFHSKPEVELYNLVDDPLENSNLAKKEPKVVALLEERMQAWIAKREKETGRQNPMFTNLHWHGNPNVPGPFESSEQAYNTLYIGGARAAKSLQEGKKK